MKKILILVNHDLVIYNFRKELIQELLNRNYEVIIVSPYGNKIEKLTVLGCKFIDCQVDRRGMNILKDIRLIFRYQEIVKQNKPTIILTFTIKPNIYGGITARKNRVPYIANITGLGPAFREQGPVQSLLIFLSRIALKNAIIFFQNAENRSFFRQCKIRGNGEKILPGSGVNLNEFNYESYPTKDEITFVFVARIMKEKGIEEFLSAAKLIKEKGINARFEICGFFEEVYYQEVFNIYLRDKIIVYNGLTDDMKSIYRRCHCIVLPSYREGLSNVVLEAAACGRPAIVSNIHGCKEAVEDQRTGFLVKVKDKEDLTLKIEQFIKLSHTEKEKMGYLARKKVEKEFDRKKVIDTYIEEIEKNT